MKRSEEPTLARLFLLAGLAAAAWSGAYILDFPDVAPLKKHNPASTAFMRQASARAREAGRPWKLQQAWVPLSDISPNLVHAVLISEDAGFYRHKGVDFDELRVALDRDIDEGRLAYGASTLTQQLAKNLFLSPARNPLRKLKEVAIAFELEKKLGKRRILELYLNVAEWGDALYGAEAAARFYFGKPASALTPEEAAALASALPNPRRFSPLKETRYLARRRRTILQRMSRAGWLAPLLEAPTPAVMLSTAAPPEAEDESDLPDGADGP